MQYIDAKYDLLINGEWVPAEGGETFETFNPANGEKLADCANASPADIDRAVAKAKAAREQGADVVAMAMHSVQEYIDYADSWQVSEAHELADTGAFDVIYGAGCHCAQPIENLSLIHISEPTRP